VKLKLYRCGVAEIYRVAGMIPCYEELTLVLFFSFFVIGCVCVLVKWVGGGRLPWELNSIAQSATLSLLTSTLHINTWDYHW